MARAQTALGALGVKRAPQCPALLGRLAPFPEGGLTDLHSSL